MKNLLEDIIDFLKFTLEAWWKDPFGMTWLFIFLIIGCAVAYIMFGAITGLYEPDFPF